MRLFINTTAWNLRVLRNSFFEDIEDRADEIRK